MKVDTYLLGHWPSEQKRLHIGAAVAPVEYNLKDQAPGRAGTAEALAGEQLAPRAAWQPAMFVGGCLSHRMKWIGATVCLKCPVHSPGPAWWRRYGRVGVPQHD